jgi:beta-glucosidase
MDQKIAILLDQLTLDEKASLTSGADQWHSTPVERLGIPALKMSDGPNGVRGLARDAHPVTSASFPVGSALAATWNPILIKQIGSALGEECHTKGVHVLLGPTVNIQRVPLAGRNFECFSEDPYLSAKMAVAYIQGVQDQGIAACVKHFVCNDQETDRYEISAEVSPRALHEIYLYPFKAAVVEAGVYTVMASYNRVNGIHASENSHLLEEILRNEWDFDGLVISDWYGTYSEKAAFNGCDLEMPGPARWMGKDPLLASLSPDQNILDQNIRRLLRTMARTGAFQKGYTTEKAIDLPEHRELIKRAGVEAITLLKNAENILPLDPNRHESIALIGQLAEQVSFQGGGSSQVSPHYVVSPLEALQRQFPGKIHFAQGYDIHRQPPLLEKHWMVKGNNGPKPFSISYFGNTNLAGDPVHQASSLSTSLGWFGETAEHWDPKQFSLRLEGPIVPSETREYTLTLAVIGRGRLLIDQEEVIDLWDVPSAEQSLEIDLVMTAGKQYTITIEYACDLDVRWRSVRLGASHKERPDLLREAVDLAARTELALVVVGLSPEWESEGFDRDSLALPGMQNALISEVAKVNPNTVVILHTGSPVSMPWLDNVPAILQAWYLGQESGNALADILVGKHDPGGRLPITFPADIKDTPAYPNFPGQDGKVHYQEGIFVGYRHYDANGIAPLFPFGHGLSFTSFDYQNLQLNGERFTTRTTIEISAEITNTGSRSGQEVVQLYLHKQDSSVSRPAKELKRFLKLDLMAGETATVSFTLNESDLAYYKVDQGRWAVEPGSYEILLGRSSNNILLRKTFHWE